MPAGPRILFFADAGPEVGGGHVMRCLTLARALGRRGA
jgi:spore coat polysaccharide biosynthesis predicted glycosyltransferase SpsG